MFTPLRSTLCATMVWIFLLALPSPGKAETIALSLEELIGMALEFNPQIEIALQQFEQTKGGVTQARSVYLPRLSAGAGYSRNHINDLEPVDEDNVGRLTLSGSQLIYDFGRATGLIDSAKFNADAAKSNLVQFLHDIIFEVKQNYYTVLERELLIEVAKQTITTYEQQLYRAERFFEAGVRTKIDITNSEVELSNATLDLLRARSDLKAARVKLEQVLGTVPNNGDYSLQKDAPALSLLAESKPPLTNPLNFYLDNAADSRPVIKRIGALIASSEASLKGAKGNYWPSFDLTGEYTDYQTDISSLTDQWAVGVGLRWEFFSGFETKGEVAEARARVRELEASLRDLQLSITQDVTDSYLRADENREAVDLANQTMELARENLELAEGRYKAGLNDIIEFNNAQLSFATSQSNLVVSYYDYLTAIARVERASGIMPELNDEQIEQIFLSANQAK